MRSQSLVTIKCVFWVILALSLKICESSKVDGVRDINLLVGCGFLGQEVLKTGSDRMNVTINANPQKNSVTITVYDSVSQFIALHFSYLRLRQSENIVIRDPDHSDQVIGLSSANASDDLYTRPLYTNHLVIEFFLAIPIQDMLQEEPGDGCYGFHIDHYRYLARASFYSTRKLEDICGADDSQEAACIRVDRKVFQKSNAVIRLLVHKSTASVFCTGWLVGSEGHVMTNHHCIGTPKEAASTTFEFLAQGETCKDQCNYPLACKGIVEASSALLVASSPTEELDYALLLPNLSQEDRKALVDKYGFLSMRKTAPNLHETIYIPQHPQGFGKRIATKNQAQKGKILSTNLKGCNLRNSSFGYALDTRGGSSGSPVISDDDHNVVGLHYCGGCLNSAIPAHLIIEDLERKKSIPLNTVVGSVASLPTPTLIRPSTENPVKVLETRWRISGSVVEYENGISIDIFLFAVAADGLVELDVLAYEYSEETQRFQDVNSDCDGSYFDSKIILFQVLETSNIHAGPDIKDFTLFDRAMVLIAENNDAAGKRAGTADGSISDKDSYMRIFLQAGDYAVAIGPNSFTIEEVINGKRARIEDEAHSLYQCGVSGTDHGNYVLTFRSTELIEVNFNRSRYTSWTAPKCQALEHKQVSLHSRCPYHNFSWKRSLKPRAIVDGTIYRTENFISVDHILLEITETGYITIDVLSYEKYEKTNHSSGLSSDLNNDCDHSFIDSEIYLFPMFDAENKRVNMSMQTLLSHNDNDDSYQDHINFRRSISPSDSYLELLLPKGEYVLAIGRHPLSVEEAVNGVIKQNVDSGTPAQCSMDSAGQYGNYQILFGSTSDSLKATSAGSFIGSQCDKKISPLFLDVCQ